jgi:hypothetical protein
MLQSMSILNALADNADFLGIPVSLWILFALVVIVWGIYFYRRGRMK